MTHAIELAPEFEEIAADQARRSGKSVDEYLPEVLTRALIGGLIIRDAHGTTDVTANADGLARTGADLLARWAEEGAFLPAEEAPDAPALARRIRERSQRRLS